MVSQSVELLKALAHPERLRLLAALYGGEECVCHLTALLAQRQPYVSQQLAYLRDAGILQDRREGLRVYYHIADPRVMGLLDALGEPTTHKKITACACPHCARNGDK